MIKKIADVCRCPQDSALFTRTNWRHRYTMHKMWIIAKHVAWFERRQPWAVLERMNQSSWRLRNGTSRRRRFGDANSARPRRHQLGVGTIRRRLNSTKAIRRGDISAHRRYRYIFHTTEKYTLCPKKVSPLNILQQPQQTCTDLNEILHTQDDIYFCHRRQIS